MSGILSEAPGSIDGSVGVVLGVAVGLRADGCRRDAVLTGIVRRMPGSGPIRPWLLAFAS